jgi:CheY-like chemotaxis protein
MPDPNFILLVEDQEADQFIATRNLTRHWPTVTVVTASDGEEAIAILESDPDNLPDLILLDINMPRMDGHEFLETWTGRHDHEVPVIVMLTSSDNELDKQRSRKFRCVKDYILKPLDKQTISMLDSVLIK